MQQWRLSWSDTDKASASQACSCLPKSTSAFCLLYFLGCCVDEAAVGLDEEGAGTLPSPLLFLAKILVKIFWGETSVAAPFSKGTMARQVVSFFWSFSSFSSFEALVPSVSMQSTMETISSKVSASRIEAFFKHLVSWQGCCFKLLSWLQACRIQRSLLS